MINKKYLYGIVGASRNQEKYGFKVLKDLLDAGYKVIPINPHTQEILGLKTYSSLKDVQEKIDVAIFVVPPLITLKILEEVLALEIKKVWMQPGSESEEALKYCQEHKIECISGACIMIKKDN